jgi:hypothetical protein
MERKDHAYSIAVYEEYSLQIEIHQIWKSYVIQVEVLNTAWLSVVIPSEVFIANLEPIESQSDTRQS